MRGDLVPAESRCHETHPKVTAASLGDLHPLASCSLHGPSRTSAFALTCGVAPSSRETLMFTAFIVLLWISLVIGTYATGNVVANWLVCLLGVILFIRRRRRRHFQA